MVLEDAQGLGNTVRVRPLRMRDASAWVDSRSRNVDWLIQWEASPPEGPAIVPRNADESPLIAAVLGEGITERMPLKRPPLKQNEIDLLRAWINQGAQMPAAEYLN